MCYMNHYSYKNFIPYLYMFLFIGFLAYSPLLFYLLNILSLCFFSSYYANKYIRWPVVIFTTLSLIVIYASKNYYDELSSDLDVYYGVYNIVQYDFTTGIHFFGGGIEVGWPLVYYFFGKIVNLTPIHLAVTNSIFSFLLIFIWFETKIITNIKPAERGMVYFFLLLFANFFMLGFLQRQSLTVGIILFALTAKNNRNFILLIILATFFHLSSLLVGITVYLARKLSFSPKKIIILLLSLVVLRIMLIPFMEIAISVISLDVFSHKANTFTSGNFSVSTLRFLLLYLIILPFLINYKDIGLGNEKYLYNYCVLTSISIIAFVGVPLFADRIFMTGLLIYGLYFYKYFYANNKILGIMFGLFYLYIFVLEKLNLIGGLALNDSYWARYPFWNSSIFYYLSRI